MSSEYVAARKGRRRRLLPPPQRGKGLSMKCWVRLTAILAVLASAVLVTFVLLSCLAQDDVADIPAEDPRSAADDNNTSS
jgi:hypothetical protein